MALGAMGAARAMGMGVEINDERWEETVVLDEFAEDADQCRETSSLPSIELTRELWMSFENCLSRSSVGVIWRWWPFETRAGAGGGGGDSPGTARGSV